MKTVLIIDDQELMLRILRAALSKCGVEILEATSGNDAIALLRSSPPPDLILLDYFMPGMDGVETLRHIRALPGGASIPVVMLTARDQTNIRNAASGLGVSAYITKPFSPVTLQKLIRELVPD